jgi:hypothetical protein
VPIFFFLVLTIFVVFGLSILVRPVLSIKEVKSQTREFEGSINNKALLISLA